MNSWERYLCGWFTYSSDIDATNTASGGSANITLSDYCTVGEAVVIRIPGMYNLIIENRTNSNNQLFGTDK